MKVYDILNAGPNHRFTVRGKDGQPFLVSNCCQALSAKIMKGHKVQLNKIFRVVMTTYDELVCMVPENDEEYFGKEASNILSTTPSFISGLPLGISWGTAIRYGEAKT